MLPLVLTTVTLPWEQPLQRIASSLSGPVMAAIGAIAIVLFAIVYSLRTHYAEMFENISGKAVAIAAGLGVGTLMLALFGVSVAAGAMLQ